MYLQEYLEGLPCKPNGEQHTRRNSSISTRNVGTRLPLHNNNSRAVGMDGTVVRTGSHRGKVATNRDVSPTYELNRQSSFCAPNESLYTILGVYDDRRSKNDDDDDDNSDDAIFNPFRPISPAEQQSQHKNSNEEKFLQHKSAVLSKAGTVQTVDNSSIVTPMPIIKTKPLSDDSQNNGGVELYYDEDKEKRSGCMLRKRCICVILLILLCCAIIGSLIYYFVTQAKKRKNYQVSSGIQDEANDNVECQPGIIKDTQIPQLEIHMKGITRKLSEEEQNDMQLAIATGYNSITRGCNDELERWMYNVTMINQTLVEEIQFLPNMEKPQEVRFEEDSTLVVHFGTKVSCNECSELNAFATTYPTTFSDTTAAISTRSTGNDDYRTRHLMDKKTYNNEMIATVDSRNLQDEISLTENQLDAGQIISAMETYARNKFPTLKAFESFTIKTQNSDGSTSTRTIHKEILYVDSAEAYPGGSRDCYTRSKKPRTQGYSSNYDDIKYTRGKSSKSSKSEKSSGKKGYGDYGDYCPDDKQDSSKEAKYGKKM